MDEEQKKRIAEHDRMIQEKRKRGELPHLYAPGVTYYPFKPAEDGQKRKGAPYLSPGGSLLPNKYLYYPKEVEKMLREMAKADLLKRAYRKMNKNG